MRHLSESIFGGNVKSNVNISDISTATKLLIDGLESKLKIKCQEIDGSHKDPGIWEQGWYLCHCNTRADQSVIYLHYTVPMIGAFEDTSASLRMQLSLEQNGDDLIIETLGVDVFQKYNAFCGVHYRGDLSFEKWTSLRDAHLTTNFENIYNYLIDAFWRFKQLVDPGKSFDHILEKTKECYFAKSVRTKRKIEDEVTKELSNIMKLIIK